MTGAATTIEWGSTGSASPLHYDSAGDPVDVTINIELGVFESGFDPYAVSPSTWVDAWITLDIASYNVGGNYFSSSLQVESSPFAGQQAFIWLFSDLAATSGSEWALITDGDGSGGDDWLVPGSGDQTTVPYNWRISEATELLFGASGSMVGDGVFESAAPANFEIQTFTFAAPVPEASAATWCVVGLALAMRRRRPSGSTNP